VRAAVIRTHGGPEVVRVEEMPDPSPGPGEVCVRVRAVALNHLDLWVRRGVPGAPFHLPAITGSDISGDIEACGEGVDDIATGTPVMVIPGLSCGACPRCEAGDDHLCSDYGILGETHPGGMAELLVVPRRNVLEKPERLTYAEAAALSLTFLTAWHMLKERADLRPGETLLVQAGGSGVGTAAIQIGRYLGARVLTTVGTPAKKARALALGADAVIDYRKEDLVKRVKELTARKGVDVVFEHVGGATFEASLRCLAWAGRLVTCGATAGPTATVNLRHLFFKSQSILGSTMGSSREYRDLVELYKEGHFEAVIDRVLPLSQIQEAHAVLERREAFGKVVITP